MEKLEDALWADYEKAKKLTKDVENNINEENMQLKLEEQDKVRKELIELERIRSDQSTKLAIAESECTKEKIRNGVILITSAATLLVQLIGMKMTFKFDDKAAVTSSLGRSILSNFIPKFGKK